MRNLQLPSNEPVYSKNTNGVIFNQLALKIKMDAVSNDDYFNWLDEMHTHVGEMVPGAQIAEKDGARQSPPLNTAVYYDTADYRVLPTGALLRTSCNKITHAFCAFKMKEDDHAVRRDHRYVFADEEKRTIQDNPTGADAVAIVRRLLSRKDIEHPGTFLERNFGIKGEDLRPAIGLDDYRYTFFCWLDGKDALRCSVDRAHVWDLRRSVEPLKTPFSEVEIAVYPRIAPDVAKDSRVPKLIDALANSLCLRFGTEVTKEIKYQRAAKVLDL